MKPGNFLSFDIGGTALKSAIIDHSGNILAKQSLATPQNLPAFLSEIKQQIEANLSEIRGVAISCPGKIDSVTGTVYFGGSLPFLHEVSLGARLSNDYQLPVSVINDGKAAALAELWLGNLQNIKNGAAITLGTGIGGGIIINGEILQGSHFQAGELSFMFQNMDDHSLDSLAGMRGSAVGLIESLAKISDQPDEKNGAKLFESLDLSLSSVQSLISQYSRSVAETIYNLAVVLDLQRVVIGGGISSQKILIQSITEAFEDIYDSIPLIKQTLTMPEIMSCHFKNDANLLGALYHLLEKQEKKLVMLSKG